MSTTKHHSRALLQYHINNTDSVNNIQKVDQIKDLGILYDSHLTFKDHIQKKLIKHILWLDSHNGLPTFAFYTHFRTHFRTLFIRILYERTFALSHFIFHNPTNYCKYLVQEFQQLYLCWTNALGATVQLSDAIGHSV